MDSHILSSRDGIISWHHFDPVTEETILETTQDAGELAELNRALRNEFDERAGWKGEFHRVASIPLTVYHELEKAGVTRDQAAFKRWLNDPDNRVFRTRPGRV